MFSQGQLIFGACFAIAFIFAMIIAYRKDANLHRMFYKGNYKMDDLEKYLEKAKS